MINIHKILQQYWGFDAFRPLQEDIINAVLKGDDALALLPTGGGKSVCFQVPALTKDGLCLVISPLIALMKDQVENLRRKGITAFAVYSGMSQKEVINVFKTAIESNCKFLYVSPERLETSLFLEYLPGMHINLIAVDEAHCISQWGYDFRPPYLRIAALREQLPGVPVLALTASATPMVQKDICDKLLFKTQNIFRQSFERSNLSYSVFAVDSKINKLLEIFNNVAGSGIVYCKSRKRTKEISNLLQLHNMQADFYHAGLLAEERNKKQEEWINNKTRIIVCTNAFGMGIDKADVRVVAHADIPDCLENYYQEAGRAGRDGKKAYAVLLYNEKDIQELEELTEIRFPSFAEIQNVYQAAANYLQIASGSGEGIYFDFDMADFLKKFRLDGNAVLYSLKALEQAGWLSFNEHVFLSSTVIFTVNKMQLYEFENSHPQLEALCKALLRAYEGIFDYPASVSETVLARLLKKDKEEIKNDLLQLHRFGIIDYNPQKDKPQMLLLRNRVKNEELFINMNEYNHRKEQFRRRVESMIHFTKETVACRSIIIGAYFGDNTLLPCGICDNCLRLKKTVLTKEEFSTINQRITHILQASPSSASQLLQQLSGIKKEKAWKVISFLQAENKIELDKKGLLKLTAYKAQSS